MKQNDLSVGRKREQPQHRSTDRATAVNTSKRGPSANTLAKYQPLSTLNMLNLKKQKVSNSPPETGTMAKKIHLTLDMLDKDGELSDLDFNSNVSQIAKELPKEPEL